tara:strand:- start:13 stop:1077 length:1065 start_codon:yes stop_codon:yes gene_type:complete
MLGLSSGLMYGGFVGELVGWDPNYINDNTSHTCLMWYDFEEDSDDGTYWLNKTNASGGNRVTAKINPNHGSGLGTGAFVGAGSSGNAMSNKVVSSDELSICVVFTDTDDHWNESGSGGGFSVPFEFRLMEQDASSRVWRYNVFKDYQSSSVGDVLDWNASIPPAKKIFHQWGQYASNTTSVYQAHTIVGDGGANPPFTPQMSQASLIDGSATGVQWMTFHAIEKSASASNVAGKVAFGDNFNSNRWSAVDSWWPLADGTNDAIDACMKGYDASCDDSKWPYDIDFSVDDSDNKIIFNRLKASGTPAPYTELVDMPWEGTIHEVIMFEGDLYSDGTYQYLQNYLVLKYNSTGLFY